MDSFKAYMLERHEEMMNRKSPQEQKEYIAAREAKLGLQSQPESQSEPEPRKVQSITFPDGGRCKAERLGEMVLKGHWVCCLDSNKAYNINHIECIQFYPEENK